VIPITDGQICHFFLLRIPTEEGVVSLSSHTRRKGRGLLGPSAGGGRGMMEDQSQSKILDLDKLIFFVKVEMKLIRAITLYLVFCFCF